MTYELARSLLLTEVVSSTALARALFTSVSQEVSLVRALLDTRAIDPARLDAELSRVDVPALRTVIPVRELVERLPPGLCARLMALPVRRDAMTGTIDVAVADARDPHPSREIGYWLAAPVRTIRASIFAIEEALRRSIPPEHRAPAVRAPASRRTSNTPPWGYGLNPQFPPPPRVPTPVPPKGNSDMPIPLTRGKTASTFPAPGRTEPAAFDGEHSYELPTGELEPAVEPALELSRVRMPSFRPPSIPPDTERRIPSIIPGPPPITKPGPFSTTVTADPLADISGTLEALRNAHERDEVLDLVLAGARTIARKVALFVAKHRVFVGWTCSREFGDEAALQEIQVPLYEQSVLETAVNEGLYLGPMRADDVHAPILAVMGGATREVAAASIKVSGRTAVIVLADELADTMIGTRRLDELARAAGEALERIVRARK